MRPRVIPVLLLRDGQLYKTVRFGSPTYVGDPRIAVKIFNDRGCDELILLDIMASRMRKSPDFKLIEEIVTESFMPVAYGGGIRSVDEARSLFSLGVEKVVLNTSALTDPGLVSAVSTLAGASSTVVSIDVRRDWMRRRRVYATCGTRVTHREPVDWAKEAVLRGAGEILVNAIERDGKMQGYDVALIKDVATAVDVPVIALGGAGKAEDLRAAVDAGADASAAGSLFVFQGPQRAVLINYPDEAELDALFA
jgi:cyclase